MYILKGATFLLSSYQGWQSFQNFKSTISSFNQIKQLFSVDKEVIVHNNQTENKN